MLASYLKNEENRLLIIILIILTAMENSAKGETKCYIRNTVQHYASPYDRNGNSRQQS